MRRSFILRSLIKWWPDRNEEACASYASSFVWARLIQPSSVLSPSHLILLCSVCAPFSFSYSHPSCLYSRSGSWSARKRYVACRCPRRLIPLRSDTVYIPAGLRVTTRTCLISIRYYQTPCTKNKLPRLINSSRPYMYRRLIKRTNTRRLS
ncbi:hypothetical protein BU16DRAFT_116129 [Lophium mytilinum]|uniref:Uncharacterized protein n=1 Tax=Lophium mytilinum TaxID=390894 RepID=A0A6A6QFX3_9PEZI|nr:hypothetical protein BU16DRAFT_116129 [Lophium mytilinum]